MILPEEVLRSLAIQTDSRLILVVIDGLGGLPVKGKAELEAAKTPNLDRLASKSYSSLDAGQQAEIEKIRSIGLKYKFQAPIIK